MDSLTEERLIQGDREIAPEDLDHLRQVVELFPSLSRKELAATLCEHWQWKTVSGTHKLTACIKLLEKLEALGEISLSPKREYRPQRVAMPPQQTSATDPGDKVVGSLGHVSPVSLELVDGGEEKRLWNEYVERYHYLGHKKPIGYRLRYFVESSSGRLGCLLVAGAAKRIEHRDCWIGWSDAQRLKNLPWVVNNTRFLVFPWVRIDNLASHVLGQLARRLREDWHRCWGYRPVLLETFVDPAHFAGSCYRGAGWRCLGRTSGTGLPRPGHEYTSTPKLIFVRPLVANSRALLCSDDLNTRSREQ
jgi:hypothetical protein